MFRELIVKIFICRYHNGWKFAKIRFIAVNFFPIKSMYLRYYIKKSIIS